MKKVYLGNRRFLATLLALMLCALPAGTLGSTGETLADTVAPGLISDIHIDSTDHGIVYLSWAAPGDGNQPGIVGYGTVDGFEIRYATDPGTLREWTDATLVENIPAPGPMGSVQTVVITSLDPITEYGFAIKSFDIAGNVSKMSRYVYCYPIRDSVIRFPDPSLETWVRYALGATKSPFDNRIDRIDLIKLVFGRARKHMGDLKLSGLLGLTVLELVTKCRISDLSGIENLSNLEYASFIGSDSLSDIAPLANLKKLRTLRLRRGNVRDLEPLGELTQLSELSLIGCQNGNIGGNIGFVGRLTNLHTLCLSASQVIDLSPLANLSELTVLGLDHNRIENIEALKGLTKLEKLMISENHIRDLRPLAGLTALTELHCHNNRVTDVQGLTALTKLCFLRLGNNDISDVCPLLDCHYSATCTSPLPRFTFGGNPLSDTSINECIPALEERGIEVYY